MKRTVLDAGEFFTGLLMVTVGAGFFDWRIGFIVGGGVLLTTSIFSKGRD